MGLKRRLRAGVRAGRLGFLWNRRGGQYASPAFVLRHGAGVQPANARGVHRLPDHGAFPRLPRTRLHGLGRCPSAARLERLEPPAVKVDDHRDYHYRYNDDYDVSVFLRPFENSHSWPPFHGDGDPVEMKIELEKSEAAK